jgi:hypothetical protein
MRGDRAPESAGAGGTTFAKHKSHTNHGDKNMSKKMKAVQTKPNTHEQQGSYDHADAHPSDLEEEMAQLLDQISRWRGNPNIPAPEMAAWCRRFAAVSERYATLLSDSHDGKLN